MSFHLYNSTDSEFLAKKLSSIIQRKNQDPFKTIQIVIQSQGMASWLKQVIAQEIGISINLEFPFINKFITDTINNTLRPELKHDTESYSIQSLTLKIFHYLMENTEDIPELHHFIKRKENGLGNSDKELRCYQLANKIAGTFDQYQIYRPFDILNGRIWEEESTNSGWQKKIWEMLSANKTSRAEGLKNFLDSANLDALEFSEIFIFGITNIPPIYLDFFRKLSEKVDVHFFYNTPCATYWGDTKDIKKRLTYMSEFATEYDIDEESLFLGNELLGNYGKTGRDFFNLLLNCDLLDDTESLNKNPDESETILQIIQRNIKENINPQAIPESLTDDDKSLMFHNVHNINREVEVLYENILKLITDPNENITPKDIIVMTPDITTYAPYIKAVFERKNAEMLDREDSKERITLPYALCDVNLSNNSTIITAFTKLLNLPASRLTASEMIDFINVDAISQAYNVSEMDIEYIQKWIRESGFRWGKDQSDHQKSCDVKFEEGSWKFAINRLLLGIAINDSDTLWPSAESDIEEIEDGISPYPDIEFGQMQTLSKFIEFTEKIFDIKEKFSSTLKISEWCDTLSEIFNSIFAPSQDEVRDVSTIMGGIENLRHYAVINNLLDMEVSIAPIREFLQGAMSEEKLNQGFLRGRITIGTLQPMRSIPRKVVYLLGMNEGEFPRKDIKLTFNLLEKKPVLCQREMQAEDRYLFLEAIMSARKKLIVSYIGQNIKSNEEEPPAVVLSELMDHVEKYFPINITELITKHPLQPFNPNYFTGTNPNLFSYSKEDYDVAVKLISKKEVNNRFICNPPLREKVITIDELIAFYENPIKSLFSRLSAYLPPLNKEIKDLEDLEGDSLSKYSMDNKMVETLVKENLLTPNDDEETTNNILNKLYYLSTKKLEWPIGSYGKIAFDTNKEDFLNKIIKIAPNNENILELKKQCTEKINIEIPLNNSLTLAGTIDNISINGDSLVHLNFRYTSLKGKDLIRGIIKHIILSVATDKEVTTYIQGNLPTPKKNHILENSRENRQEHSARLIKLINFYLDTQPTPIFPNAAYAYAINKNERLKKAKDAAQPNFDKSGTAELLDEYISLCYNSTVFDNKNEMEKFIEIVKTLFKEIDDTIDEETEEENNNEAKSEQPK